MSPVERFTSYCAVGGDRVAYQVIGTAGPDLLYLTGVLSQVDARWLSTSYASFLSGLSSFARVITLDRRGTGASDRPPPGDPSVDHLDDVLSVLDATGATQVIAVGIFDAVPLMLRLAAQHPERVTSLVLWAPTARLLVDDDYPEGLLPENWDRTVDTIADGWGRDDVATRAARTADEQRWLVQMQRASCSPAEVRHVYDAVLRHIDVRPLVPHVKCPVIVLRRPALATAMSGQAEWLLRHLPDARAVSLPGQSQMLHEESEPVLAVLQDLVADGQLLPERSTQRRVATVLFVDVVGSTDLARRLGDRHWTEVLRRHDEWIAHTARRFAGRVVNRTGDGALLVFEGPAAAIACGLRLVTGDPSNHLDVRIGIHTGEVELRGDDLAGVAVHVGARVGAAAGPGEVLVSRTVRDLVAGSSYRFVSEGPHVIKGFDEPWELHSVLA